MAKSSHTTNFRKIDIDELDEDRFQDVASAGDAQVNIPTEGDVQNLINKKNYQDALVLLLDNAPIGADGAAKSKVFNLVLRVMLQFKANEIDPCVKSLSSKNKDILMKYIYRGFAEPTDSSCSSLLTWHQKVFAVGGLGCIMRVMTDRKSV